MVRAMGKVPVVFKQMVQGYVANRLQAAMGLEVQRMLDEGLVTAKDIDDSVIHGIALRMPILGVMAKADFTGLPLMQQGMANRSYTPPEVRGRSETLDKLIAEGRTGVMSGKGYFDWGDRSPEELFRERDRKLLALKRALRADRTDGGHMISYDLKGKTALVTGGASGIGFATARMLAKFGATVAVNFLTDDPRGPEAVDKIDAEGGRAIMAPGSVGEAGVAERMVLKAIDDLGRLDLLFNNAGTPGTRRRITPPELELITEDLWSHAAADQPARRVPRFQGGGAGAEGGAGRDRQHRLDRRDWDVRVSSLAYSATKAGVVSLTQNLARALAPEVRVNAIAPGAVDSSWMVEWTNEERQQSIERALLKRRCQPEDLAEVVVFLGFGAAMVTGQTITVDGGLTL